jgi:hypothetical protein
MRSRSSITVDPSSVVVRGRLIVAAWMLLLFASVGLSQRIAIIAPERSPHDIAYIESLSENFRLPLRVLDHSMADTAFRSTAVVTPFNMSVTEARAAASVIGCDILLLIRSGEQRRASFAKPEYYEAFAFLYLIDGRSGKLISWRRSFFEADTQVAASKTLAESVASTAATLTREILDHCLSETHRAASIEDVPAEGSPAAVGLKPPIPYRRIKPAYTETAFLYDVRATIDAEADIGADGTVLALHFVRWAGFGLEESVEKAVRQMNWRPAMRNGKPLPMRILLRYNFTKVDKE